MAEKPKNGLTVVTEWFRNPWFVWTVLITLMSLAAALGITKYRIDRLEVVDEYFHNTHNEDMDELERRLRDVEDMVVAMEIHYAEIKSDISEIKQILHNYNNPRRLHD